MHSLPQKERNGRRGGLQTGCSTTFEDCNNSIQRRCVRTVGHYVLDATYGTSQAHHKEVLTMMALGSTQNPT